jgi:hypothetical protein
MRKNVEQFSQCLKMRVAFAVAIVVGFGLLPESWAAPDLGAIPPPSAPYVAVPPDFAEWSVSVTPQAKSKPAETSSPEAVKSVPASGPGGVTAIKSTKTGKIKRDVLEYKGRPSQEYWFAGDYIVTLRSNRKDYAIVDASIMNPGPEIKGIYRELGKRVLSPGFPGCDWIDKKHYQGVVLFEKTRPSYYYALKGAAPDTGEQIVAAEAWIDVETKLPLRYSSEGIDFTYRFGERPASMLELPVKLNGVNLR